MATYQKKIKNTFSDRNKKTLKKKTATNDSISK